MVLFPSSGGKFPMCLDPEKSLTLTMDQRPAWKPQNNRVTLAHQHQKRVDSSISNAWWLRMRGVYLHSFLTSSCYLPPGLASKNFAFCPQSVFFLWKSEQMAIISLYSIKWSVFTTETECLLRGTGWTFPYNWRWIKYLKGLLLTLRSLN